MSLTISHSIMNNINLYHVFFVMADIRMLVDAIHYSVERLGFTEIKSLQLEVVLAIATGQDVFGVQINPQQQYRQGNLLATAHLARTSAINVQR